MWQFKDNLATLLSMQKQNNSKTVVSTLETIKPHQKRQLRQYWVKYHK